MGSNDSCPACGRPYTAHSEAESEQCANGSARSASRDNLDRALKALRRNDGTEY